MPPTDTILAKRGMREIVEEHTKELGFSRFGKGKTIRLMLDAAWEDGVRPDPDYKPDYEPYGDGQFYQVQFHVRLPPGDGSAGLDGREMGSLLDQWLPKRPRPKAPFGIATDVIACPDELADSVRISALRSGKWPGQALSDLWAEAVRRAQVRITTGPMAGIRDQWVRLTADQKADYHRLVARARRVRLDARSVVAFEMMEIQGER